MTQPELYQCIALSTCHITQETAQYLENTSNQDLPFNVMARDEGFFIKLHPHFAHNLTKDVPSDLSHLIAFAFALDLDCLLIELDRDATVYDDLQTYNW